MGCGCGGGRANRPVQVPHLQNNNVANVAAQQLHPNVVAMQTVQKLAEERRKTERLRREYLLKTLAKP